MFKVYYRWCLHVSIQLFNCTTHRTFFISTKLTNSQSLFDYQNNLRCEILLIRINRYLITLI